MEACTTGEIYEKELFGRCPFDLDEDVKNSRDK